MNSNRLVAILILLVLVVGITGCGSTKTATVAPASTSDETTILIQSFSFQPAEVYIQKGSTVTWINQDSVGHTVTGKSFNSSGLLNKGQSFKQTFSETGVFEYYCSPHPKMQGKIIVQ